METCWLKIGAILHQEQNGKDRIISYASLTLNNNKAIYPAHKLVSGIEIGYNR